MEKKFIGFMLLLMVAAMLGIGACAPPHQLPPPPPGAPAPPR